MDQLQAGLQQLRKELDDLRSITNTWFNSSQLETNQNSRQRRYTTQPTRGWPQPTETVPRPLRDALTRFESSLEQFDQRLKDVLSSASTRSNSDTPPNDPSSVADPLSRTTNTSSSTDSFPAISKVSRTPLPSAPSRRPRGRNGLPNAPTNTRPDTPQANAPPTTPLDTRPAPPNAPNTSPSVTPNSPPDAPPETRPGARPTPLDTPPHTSPDVSLDAPLGTCPAARDAPLDTCPAALDAPLDAPLNAPLDAPLDTALDAPLDAPLNAPLGVSLNAPLDTPPSTLPGSPVNTSLDAPLDTCPAALDAPPSALPGSPPDASPHCPPNAPPDAPPDNAPKPTFTLKRSDLGGNLIPKLQTFIRDSNFTGKLLVEDIGLTPTKLTDALRPLERPDFDAQFEIVHQLDKDIWRLFSNPVKDLQPLDLNNITKPSGDMEQYLENLYRNAPEKPIPYYIGPLSGPIAQELQSLFSSGSEVAQLGDIAGVSTLFGHVGGAASGTSSHHEDAGLRSYNLTFFGWKIWLQISRHHTTKYEALVRRLTHCDFLCDQFVRHTSIIIPPSRLREENIDFTLFCSGPGEMVVTEPGQYHAVVNWTRCGSIATNFTLSGEDPIPSNIFVCRLDGLYSLEHPKIQQLRNLKRKGRNSQLGRPPRSKRSRLDRPSQNPIVKALADETTSQDAILRFMATVCAWRKVHNSVRSQLSQISTCDKSQWPVAFDTLRTTCSDNSQLFSFLEILTSVHIVRNIERHISTIAPRAIDRLLENRGLQDTRQNRGSIQKELARYDRWDQLCGETSSYTYEGILCFVPPVFKVYSGVSRTQIQELGKDEIASFRSALGRVEHVPCLCEVGRAFQAHVLGITEFPTRRFEELPYSTLSTLSLSKLLELLKAAGE